MHFIFDQSVLLTKGERNAKGTREEKSKGEGGKGSRISSKRLLRNLFVKEHHEQRTASLLLVYVV